MKEYGIVKKGIQIACDKNISYAARKKQGGMLGELENECFKLLRTVIIKPKKNRIRHTATFKIK